MSVWEKVLGAFHEEEDFEERGFLSWLVIGPLSLFCTFAFSSFFPFRLDLFFAAAIGLFLSFAWQLRGCVYALFLLIITSLIHHLLVPKDHLWQLGIEMSIGFAFFITALCTEEKKAKELSLKSLVETKSSAIINLEQDLAALNEEFSQEKILLQDKIVKLQKEIEETGVDHASILILNDVLRKKAAYIDKELKEAKIEKQGGDFKVAHLQSELAFLKKELALFQEKGEFSELAQRIEEINQYRYLLEQRELDLEALKRRLKEESLKASHAQDQLAAIFEEKGLLEAKLQKRERELEEISEHWVDFSKERDLHRSRLQAYEKLSQEHLFLKERLTQAQLEIEMLEKSKQESLSIKATQESSLEDLKEAHKTIESLREVEHLYKQLKLQFQEKTEILGAVRKELFHKDTALQALEKEKDLLLEPLSFEVQKEVAVLEEELSLLEKENLELIELVSHFFKVQAPSEKKK